MAYRVVVLSRAAKDLAKLERLPAYRAVRAALLSLADDPRPPGCKKLTLAQGWRVRVGDYRIIYDIDDVVRIVSVERVGHRRDVYAG